MVDLLTCMCVDGDKYDMVNYGWAVARTRLWTVLKVLSGTGFVNLEFERFSIL